MHADARPLDVTRETSIREGFVGERLCLHLAEGEPVRVEKLVALHTSRDPASAGCREQACTNAVVRATSSRTSPVSTPGLGAAVASRRRLAA